MFLSFKHRGSKVNWIRMRLLRLLSIAFAISAFVTPIDRAAALGWYPASTTITGEPFFGITRAQSSGLIRYIECGNSNLSGKTPVAGFNGWTSPELSVSLGVSSCRAMGSLNVSASGPTGPIKLIAKRESWSGVGGGDVVIPWGTTYTFSLNQIWNCTFKVNFNGGVFAPDAFTFNYLAELDINRVPVHVEVSGPSATICGTSTAWYLDAWYRVRPSIYIQ